MPDTLHTNSLTRLTALLGDRLVTSEADRRLHGQNETYYPNTPPDAVAYPETTAEVSEIVKICADTGTPVTPYGAASSLEGQHLAVQGGISLDFARMNRLLSVSAEDLLCTAQPGLTRKRLNEDLRDTGLFFSVDPGADASLGGMAATRASGTTAVRYGTIRENILALEAVMADGTIIRTGSEARKSATGYDLTHLLIGSEGTLGIITELTLRLHGLPESVAAATCRFASVEDAVNCVILTIQSGLPMARIELLDHMMVRGFNRYAQADLPEEPHLFLEFHGSEAGVAEQSAAFREIAADFGAALGHAPQRALRIGRARRRPPHLAHRHLRADLETGGGGDMGADPRRRDRADGHHRRPRRRRQLPRGPLRRSRKPGRDGARP